MERLTRRLSENKIIFFDGTSSGVTFFKGDPEWKRIDEICKEEEKKELQFQKKEFPAVFLKEYSIIESISKCKNCFMFKRKGYVALFKIFGEEKLIQLDEKIKTLNIQSGNTYMIKCVQEIDDINRVCPYDGIRCHEPVLQRYDIYKIVKEAE